MPELPWQGDWISLTVDGEISWRRCAVCGRPLDDQASRQRGYGPTCATQTLEELIEEKKNAAIQADRNKWRGERRYEDFLKATGRSMP